MIGDFEELVKKLPFLFEQLIASPLRSRTGLGKLPQEGIYIFYENEQPIYVGRTNRLKERILEHGRTSASHNSAPFAFNLAKKLAQEKCINPNVARNKLELNPEFKILFREAKNRVAKMSIKFVPESDPLIQTVFEVYASLELGTMEYNAFDNH